MSTRLNMAAEKEIQRLSTAMFMAKKRCSIYGRKPVLRYWFYGSHPYRIQAVQGLNDTVTVGIPRRG